MVDACCCNAENSNLVAQPTTRLEFSAFPHDAYNSEDGKPTLTIKKWP
jgi:hypothetical protein